MHIYAGSIGLDAGHALQLAQRGVSQEVNIYRYQQGIYYVLRRD